MGSTFFVPQRLLLILETFARVAKRDSLCPRQAWRGSWHASASVNLVGGIWRFLSVPGYLGSNCWGLGVGTNGDLSSRCSLRSMHTGGGRLPILPLYVSQRCWFSAAL